MKYKIKSVIFLSIISLVILNIYYVSSLIIMSIYNQVNIYESKFDLNDINIDFHKQNAKWYPLMNVFNSNYFSDYVKKDIDLTILYTFGDFQSGTSVLFDPNNELFSSYYGCYITRNNENDKEYFGFDNNGKIILNELIKLPEYDFRYLVAGAMGLKDDEFILNYNLENINYSDDSVFIDFECVTNSLFHNYKKFDQNYLQYGIPFIKNENIDFYPVKLFSKFRIEKYNSNITLIYYIFSPSENLINTSDI